MQKRVRLIPAIVILMALLGTALFCYPAVSNYLAEKNQSEIIGSYDSELAKMREEDYRKEWDKAEQYNQSLAGDPVRDPFLEGSGMALPQNYLDVLNVNGIMGYIEIPKIAVNLPIYHGTDEETLKKGVGHIRQTALPIGGMGTHPVLTGHTGLPSAELFTNLDQLEIGDKFFIHVLDQTLAYQVDAINVVEPNETALLEPDWDKDYVTLITCTPYGVNSLRLLVRGIRVEYIPEEEEALRLEGHAWGKNEQILLFMGICAGVTVLILWLIFLFWRRRRTKKKKQSETERYWWKE